VDPLKHSQQAVANLQKQSYAYYVIDHIFNCCLVLHCNHVKVFEALCFVSAQTECQINGAEVNVKEILIYTCDESS
jgi:hypothetical protein